MKNEGKGFIIARRRADNLLFIWNSVSYGVFGMLSVYLIRRADRRTDGTDRTLIGEIYQKSRDMSKVVTIRVRAGVGLISGYSSRSLPFLVGLF